MWKAELWNPDEWTDLFQKPEAKYVFKGTVFSVSVCQFLEAFVTKDSVCPCWYPLDVKALILLHELEMQDVAFWEASQHVDALEVVHLVGRIGGFHKGQIGV